MEAAGYATVSHSGGPDRETYSVRPVARECGDQYSVHYVEWTYRKSHQKFAYAISAEEMETRIELVWMKLTGRTLGRYIDSPIHSLCIARIPCLVHSKVHTENAITQDRRKNIHIRSNQTFFFLLRQIIHAFMFLEGLISM